MKKVYREFNETQHRVHRVDDSISSTSFNFHPAPLIAARKNSSKRQLAKQVIIGEKFMRHKSLKSHPSFVGNNSDRLLVGACKMWIANCNPMHKPHRHETADSMSQFSWNSRWAIVHFTGPIYIHFQRNGRRHLVTRPTPYPIKTASFYSATHFLRVGILFSLSRSLAEAKTSENGHQPPFDLYRASARQFRGQKGAS